VTCNMGLKADDLRHRITLQRATTSSVVGQHVQSWSDVATYWAKVTPKSGTENPSEEGTGANVTYTVQMRFVSGITPKDRFHFNGRTLNIESVINVDERNIELEIECVEVV
jgi:SPP1 family predicted phage head-tail adaptor